MNTTPGLRWPTAISALAGAAVAALVYLLYRGSWIGPP
jgi:hypothetical protein